MPHNKHYNKDLKSLARRNRQSGNKAEILMWTTLLKGRQMMGYKFLRQRPVLNYIADFMCKELNLIIEIDGTTHLFKDIFEKDKKKQIELEKAGFKVLRFTNWEVMNDIGEISVILTKWIEEYEEMHPEVQQYNIRKSKS